MRRVTSFFIIALLLIAVNGVRAQVIVNASFENPAVVGPGNFIYTTDVTGWTFSPFDSAGGTGLSGNGSAFGPQDIGGLSDSGGGIQAAIIQSGGALSQAIDFLGGGGGLLLSLFIEARGSAGGGNPLRITIDSTPILFGGNATVSPSSGSTFDFVVSDPFSVGAGLHTLTIAGTIPFSSGDQTTFVDQVSVTQVPEASTLALVACGLVGLMLVRRRRS